MSLAGPCRCDGQLSNARGHMSWDHPPIFLSASEEAVPYFFGEGKSRGRSTVAR